MKVLHINSYYNGSQFYKNLFDEQVAQGITPSIYVPVLNKTNKLSIEDDGYVHVSRILNKTDRFFFKYKQNKIFNDLKKKLEINDFDIIHAHSLFSNGYNAMKLKKENNLPYIVAVRNTDVNIFLKRVVFLRKIGVEILKNASAIIFLSSSYRDNVLKNYIPKNIQKKILDKSYIVPNGIDDFWFRNLYEPKSIKRGTKIKVLFIGRISENKNIMTVVNALDLLQKEKYEVKLMAIGKIHDQKIYNKLIKYNFVSYHPFADKEDLLKHYRESNIFIMPSKTESFGLVYVESMTQGTPIIYSKGQGFDNQFVDGEIGYRVIYNDYEKLAQLIKKTLENYNKLSYNCIKNSKKFKWSKIAATYYKIYKSNI